MFIPLCVVFVQVYSATNVELVTRSRTEHLSDQDKLKSKGDSTRRKQFCVKKQWPGKIALKFRNHLHVYLLPSIIQQIRMNSEQVDDLP